MGIEHGYNNNTELCTFHICTSVEKKEETETHLKYNTTTAESIITDGRTKSTHTNTHTHMPILRKSMKGYSALYRKWCRGKMLILLKFTFSIFFQSDPFLCPPLLHERVSKIHNGRYGDKERAKEKHGDNEWYIWFNCFVFNHCCLYLNNFAFMGSSVCTCNQFKWLSWSTFITTVLCVCCCCFFFAQSSILWNRYKFEIQTEISSHSVFLSFIFCFVLCFFITHIQSSKRA